ncbi:hypothetical protein PVL29_018263 [Vitis rotundifolia]|uniref:Uncharacterized protein n=1 Tax=Vitis rotundifolia TaxID=103349 RepID=A0AA38Z4U5_VITRO|nr:hypothetical protein PVL29_018263 [Vitis rotundifolia]
MALFGFDSISFRDFDGTIRNMIPYVVEGIMFFVCYSISIIFFNIGSSLATTRDRRGLSHRGGNILFNTELGSARN